MTASIVMIASEPPKRTAWPSPNRITGQNATTHTASSAKFSSREITTVPVLGTNSVPGWPTSTYRLPFSSTNRGSGVYVFSFDRGSSFRVALYRTQSASPGPFTRIAPVMYCAPPLVVPLRRNGSPLPSSTNAALFPPGARLNFATASVGLPFSSSFSLPPAPVHRTASNS